MTIINSSYQPRLTSLNDNASPTEHAERAYKAAILLSRGAEPHSISVSLELETTTNVAKVAMANIHKLHHAGFMVSAPRELANNYTLIQAYYYLLCLILIEMYGDEFGDIADAEFHQAAEIIYKAELYGNMHGMNLDYVHKIMEALDMYDAFESQYWKDVE